MSEKKLFSEYKLGSILLKNRVVMAPMTRSRASADHIPSEIMVLYYQQRASAGLLVTEGTAPSKNGIGYARTPGIYTNEQLTAWKKVTDAVHDASGHIYLQIMHAGRISHPLNQSAGSRIVAPSAVQPAGEMYTDQEGMKAFPVPEAIKTEDIQATIQEYVQAAKNAITAGFDGIELHAANGYLLEQFLNPKPNQRNDEYGGSIENRCRFVVEVATQVAEAIGKDRVGIRLSPYGAFSDVASDFPGLEEQATYLATELDKIGLTYIHLVDHSSMGAPEVKQSVKDKIRKAFSKTLILSGGYDKTRAEQDIEQGRGDLIAFGKAFISNPDLVHRLEQETGLSAFDMNTFYSPGEHGYIDYPVAEAVKIN